MPRDRSTMYRLSRRFFACDEKCRIDRLHILIDCRIENAPAADDSP